MTPLATYLLVVAICAAILTVPVACAAALVAALAAQLYRP